MKEERRLEILGIFIIALSFFILVSLGGFNPQEEPTISPSVKVENPMGRLGVAVAYFGIKLGFGYPIFILPLLGIVWGWLGWLGNVRYCIKKTLSKSHRKRRLSKKKRQ